MYRKLSAMLYFVCIAVCCLFSTGCDTSSDSKTQNYTVNIVGSAGSSRVGSNYAHFAPALRADTSTLTGLQVFVYDQYSNEIISIDQVSESNITGDGKVLLIKNYNDISGKDIRVEIKRGNDIVVKAYKSILETNETVDVNSDSTALSKIYEAIKDPLGSNFKYSVFEKAMQNANVTLTTDSVAALSDGIQSYLIQVAIGAKVLSGMNLSITALVNQTSEIQNQITEEGRKILNADTPAIDDIKTQFLPASMQGKVWAKVTSQNVDKIAGAINGGNIWLVQEYIYNGDWYKWTVQGTTTGEQYIPYLFLKQDYSLIKMKYNSDALNDNKILVFSNDNAYIMADGIRDNGGLTRYISTAETKYALDFSSSTIRIDGVTKHIRIATDTMNTYVILYDNESAAETEVYKAINVY